MNLNQYTVKSQESIQAAQQVAMELGNQSIEPQHLLEGIFQVDENISPFLLKKSEADANLVRERNRENLEKLPKVPGGEMPFVEGFFFFLLTGDIPSTEDVKEVAESVEFYLPHHH